MVVGSSTRHTRARRQLGNNNKMFPCDWFKGEPLISAPAIFRFSFVMWIYSMRSLRRLTSSLECVLWKHLPCSTIFSSRHTSRTNPCLGSGGFVG